MGTGTNGFPGRNLTMTYNEDSFLESQYEERTECDFYVSEEDSRWEWTGQHDWVEDDEEEEEEGEEFDCEEISYEEKYACDLYNEQYSYPYYD